MIALSINAERGYVIITIKGSPSLEDYVEACHALGEHENFYPETHRVCDFSQIDDLSVSTTELLAFVKEARKLPKADSARTALIAKNQEDRGTMELFSSHFDAGTFKTFKSGRDALAWVLWAVPEVAPTKDSDKIRYHRLSGDVDGNAVISIQSGWFNDENFDPSAPVMWDLTRAKVLADRPELLLIANGMFSNAEVSGRNGRAAILVNLLFQKIIFEEAFSKGIASGRTRVLMSESDAQEWLLEGAA